MSTKRRLVAVAGFSAVLAVMAAIPGGMVGNLAPIAIIIWTHYKMRPTPPRELVAFMGASILVLALGMALKIAIWAGDPRVQAAWQRTHF